MREIGSAVSGAMVSHRLSGAGDPFASHPSTRKAAIIAGRAVGPWESMKAIAVPVLDGSIAILDGGSQDAATMAMARALPPRLTGFVATLAACSARDGSGIVH